jgi:cyclopropane fatty-acyl-phospholipid synthase-like methyltransferase
MFVEACAPGVVAMEIGAAMGVAALPALERGARVVANDLDAEHLREMQAACPAGARARLELLPGRFPREVRYAGGSVDLILASNVLHFLTGAQLQKGVASFAYWLRPGGRVFVQAMTPFVAPFADFAGEYEARRAAGEAFPGWIENARRYSQHGLLSQIPRSVHLLDATALSAFFAGQEWEIQRCWEYRRRDLSKTMWLDGRESVGLVARRSSRGIGDAGEAGPRP